MKLGLVSLHPFLFCSLLIPSFIGRICFVVFLGFFFPYSYQFYLVSFRRLYFPLTRYMLHTRSFINPSSPLSPTLLYQSCVWLRVKRRYRFPIYMWNLIRMKQWEKNLNVPFLRIHWLFVCFALIISHAFLKVDKKYSFCFRSLQSILMEYPFPVLNVFSHHDSYPFHFFLHSPSSNITLIITKANFVINILTALLILLKSAPVPKRIF